MAYVHAWSEAWPARDAEIADFARLASHIGTATTGTVYRKQIRPVAYGWR
jgi:hypothetical protein